MAGMGGAENNIYQTIVYLLITIPYAGSYYTDKTRGILKNIVARCDKKNYLIAKSAAVFLSAGTAAVFPLLVSLLLTATVMPLVNYDWLQMPYPTAIFIRELLVNPVLYYLLYMAVIFVTAGLVAGLSLTVSIYANNVFVVLSMPFLICIVISRLLSYMGNGFIRGLSITRIFNMCQNVPPNFVSMAVLACILFVSGYMAFVVKGVKKDVL
jgi:hypothetical protein